MGIKKVMSFSVTLIIKKKYSDLDNFIERFTYYDFSPLLTIQTKVKIYVYMSSLTA